MIRFDQVSKVYVTAGGDVRALDDISLEVGQGEFVAVRGPSGCGKSTLLSLAGGLALPTSGTVTVGSEEISSLSSAARAKFRAENVGFVFQMFHLLPYLTVRDNVLLGASSEDSTGAEELADRLLERFGLIPRRLHRPAQLSAGERQRVAMARALLNQPRVILADEPTGNLDPDSADILLDLMEEFHRDGGTVLLVTHDPRAAERSERTIRLNHGQVDIGSAECRSGDGP